MSTDKYENVSDLISVFQRFGRADWRKKTMWGGLKASEIRLLVCVKQSNDKGIGGTNVSEISKMLQVTSPTVTQMLNSLISAGYVMRSTDKTDRRITEITLTDKGEQLAQKASERFKAIFTGMIDHLGKEQSDQLVGLLNQVFEYLESAKTNDEI
ncbi:MarR family winged helix-turn-helix transcriptional regulator [Paenibacillus sp. PL91]|uniref:MarR family winged helix-turn-helix transcriptional regulator n=1 Tax=Paenibacillus sp. PL91 TaxID=2729538 RepID=UPI00145E05A3|nr:MarR family transcriptional regulator [Paenibacillus sp. PL91]MBC9201204.1 MarR family transcriptional regulator [Paenibacillus sp. PL91]